MKKVFVPFGIFVLLGLLLMIAMPKQASGLYQVIRYGIINFQPPRTATSFNYLDAPIKGVTGVNFDCVRDDGAVADAGQGVIEESRSFIEQVYEITSDHIFLSTVHTNDIAAIPSCAIVLTGIEYDRLRTTSNTVRKIVGR